VPFPPRDRNSGKPQLVGDFLAGVLDRKGLSAKLEAVSALSEWEALVGPRIAAVTRALRVSEGVLFVGVANSPWLMELNLMKSELMRRVNAGKGAGRIRQIVFVMGDETL
jgi:predicted nucleic acid-binding Zn ribbon protein